MKTSYVLDSLTIGVKRNGPFPLTLWGKTMFWISGHQWVFALSLGSNIWWQRKLSSKLSATAVKPTYHFELQPSSWHKSVGFTMFRSCYEEDTPFLPSFHYLSDPPSGSSILQTCFWSSSVNHGPAGKSQHPVLEKWMSSTACMQPTFYEVRKA